MPPRARLPLPEAGAKAMIRDCNMTVQTFRDLLKQQPFQPFRIVMSSGEAQEVRHPEMAILGRTDLFVGISNADDDLADRFKICSLLHITAIEPLGVAGPKPTGSS
jgi:hypothetical protein